MENTAGKLARILTDFFDFSKFCPLLSGTDAEIRIYQAMIQRYQALIQEYQGLIQELRALIQAYQTILIRDGPFSRSVPGLAVIPGPNQIALDAVLLDKIEDNQALIQEYSDRIQEYQDQIQECREEIDK